jgi:hypothetical protein
VLQPDDPTEFLQLTGVKSPARPGVRWVPGRGVLIVDRRPTIIQVPCTGIGHGPRDTSGELVRA